MDADIDLLFNSRKEVKDASLLYEVPH
jgi:hypothetical protein